MNRTRIITAAALTLVAAGLLLAGPLDPPAGPVTSTYKTLTEVEPRIAINATNTPGDANSLFKITQRGSYYLTGNITGVAGRHGIEIAANGVTLDLMGFDLVGSAEVAALDGVSLGVGNLANITIRNGSVRDWGDEGVDLESSINSAVIDVRASGNAGNGISTGRGSTTTGCSAYANGGNGIYTSSGSTISNCNARSNTANGIVGESGSTITGCSAYINTGSGISTGSDSTITGCTASFNTGSGIVAGEGSTITGCTVSNNTDNGISTSFGCTISNCTANNNTGNGISANNGSTISNCTARSNTLDGISAGIGSTISNCTARLNTRDGIRVTSGCVVLANTCTQNGNSGDGAGIHATGSDNRIEGNNCTFADRGIDVDFVSNIIIKNTCSDNTINWVIAANNVVGPILDRRAPASAAINGFSAPSSLGTTDPNANFSY